jgi:cysteinyl-tRNA synthetase
VAFINDYFKGETIDIHGGGIDLRFPHHTNEDAQFQGLTGKKLAEAYSYVGHINMDGQKMSKSLGNTMLVDDLIEEIGSAVLRYALISTNYSKPLNFNDNLVDNSKKEIEKITNALNKGLEKYYKSDVDFTEETNEYFEKVLEVLTNDIDTVSAITLINEMVKIINGQDVDESYVKTFNSLIKSLEVLGFVIENKPNKENKDLMKQSFENKDFDKIDELRKEIKILVK